MGWIGGGGGVQISSGERANADLAMEQWNDYKTRFLPLEKKFVSELTDKNYRRGIGLGKANAGATQRIDAANRRNNTGLMTRGVDVNSGKFLMANTAGTRGRGLGLGLVTQGISDTAGRVGNLTDAITVGRGIKGVALRGYNSAASLGNSQSIADASYRQAQANATGGLIGAAIGAGAGATINSGVFNSGANGAASGASAFSQALGAGSGISEAWAIGKGQMQANRIQ